MIDATAPHTRIDNAIIDEHLPKIGAYGLAVYTVIKRHLNFTTGQCNPSYNRIAKMLKINRRTVIRYVKRLQEAGLISVDLQFTDEGQTSNQYDFAQLERKKPAQTRTTAQKNRGSDRGVTPLVTESHPPSDPVPPEQVPLNKFNITKEETANIDISLSNHNENEKKTVPTTEKQKECPHPYCEVVTFGEGITICNHCFSLIDFLPDAEAA